MLQMKKVVYSCPVDHDGASVYVHGWLSDEKSTLPPIIGIHDIFQNFEIFETLASEMAAIGFHTYSFDLRGHGESGIKPGHMQKLDHLASDLLQVVAWIRHVHQGLKPVLFCQGVGCLIGLFFAKNFKHMIHSLVLAAPPISFTAPVHPFKRLAIKSFAEVFPTFYLPFYFSPAFIYEASKKSKEKFHLTALSVIEILNGISQTKKIMLRLNVPTFFIFSKENNSLSYDHFYKIINKNKHENIFYVHMAENYFAGDSFLLAKDKKQTLQTIAKWLAAPFSNTRFSEEKKV